jgi:hypothetical protein
MVACMQFINIVVHSVDDMNFRVALQWEFSQLGLEKYLEKLRNNESEELSVQILGKTFNFFMIANLLKISNIELALHGNIKYLKLDLNFPFLNFF